MGAFPLSTRENKTAILLVSHSEASPNSGTFCTKVKLSGEEGLETVIEGKTLQDPTLWPICLQSSNFGDIEVNVSKQQDHQERFIVKVDGVPYD